MEKENIRTKKLHSLKNWTPPITARIFCPAGPPVPVRTIYGKVAVTTLPGRYSNTHIIETEGALAIVDVGSREDLDALKSVVEELQKPVRWVTVTHLHFDHVLGVEDACHLFSAPLCLGKVARSCVENGQRPRMAQLESIPFFFAAWLWQGLPALSFRDLSTTLRVGSPLSRNRFRCPLGPVLDDGSPLPGLEDWLVLATPGHADEAICLWHKKAGFLISGDTILNFRGGEWNAIVTDENQYQTTQSRLKKLTVRAIFPGHGSNIFGHDLMKNF